MSTFKVKLTPLTPINVSHPEPLLPVETKQEIKPNTTPVTETPDLSALLLDWRFDQLSSQYPPTPEELTIFPSEFPVFDSFTTQHPRQSEHGAFPEFGSEEYDALVDAFCAEGHLFSLALPQELTPELWELTQNNMGDPLFSKSEFIPEAHQEIRFAHLGFEEFAAFGFDFDEPPYSPSEGSSEDGHGS